MNGRKDESTELPEDGQQCVSPLLWHSAAGSPHNSPFLGLGPPVRITLHLGRRIKIPIADMEAHRGKVNLERMLERKPLHAAEQQAAPATVCVTGAWRPIGAG